MITQRQAHQEVNALLVKLTSDPINLAPNDASQKIRSCMATLKDRLGCPDFLTVVYLQNPQARSTLPPSVRTIIEKRVEGQFSEIDAKEQLQRISKYYESVFVSKGYVS